MADILVVDWTTVSEVTKGSFMEGFELTSYSDGSTLDLSSSRYESIGGILYLVSGGNVSVDTSAATIDGTYYIHVKDDGDQTASAFLDSNAGTFNGELGGYYYNGGKVTHRVEKSSSNFINKNRIINTPVQNSISGIYFGNDKGIGQIYKDSWVVAAGTAGLVKVANYPTGYTQDNTYIVSSREISTVSGEYDWSASGLATKSDGIYGNRFAGFDSTYRAILIKII
jgi:hypothetical protein